MNTPPTLQVEEDWEDENVEYLVAEMGSFDATSQELEQQAERYQGCDVLGLDTESPFVRIGQLVFKGSYERLLGTDLVFGLTDKRNPSSQVPSVNLNYMGCSSKKLILQPVKLVPKKEAAQQQTTDSTVSTPQE